MKRAVLCIDIGNSRAKFTLVRGGKVRRLAAPPTDRANAGLRDVVAALPEDVEGAIVCSVVPKLTRPLVVALRALGGFRAHVVTHRGRFPFEIAVQAPASVGTDRLCAAAGAVGPRGRGAIVIDVGSAITVDVVSGGAYRGGPILIGPGLALRALGAYADQLPKLDYDRVGNALPAAPRGTEAAMVLGASLGAVGAIRAAVQWHERTTGSGLGKVVTGGGAARIRRWLPPSWWYDPDLVSRGLFRLWDLNQPRRPAHFRR